MLSVQNAVTRVAMQATDDASLWRSYFGLERGFWSAAPLLQAHPEPGLKTSGVAPPNLWRLKIVCCLSIRKELHDATSTSRCQAKACSRRLPATFRG
jgi:hypothetical protein